MKIVYICQYYNNGWGYQENILPVYQAKLGHKVTIITSNRQSYFPGNFLNRKVKEDDFFDNGVKIKRIPILFEFINRFVIFKNFYKILNEEKPDYIFHHGTSTPSLFSVVKYKKENSNIILVVDSTADFYNSARNVISRFFYHRILWKKLINSLLPYIDKIYCVTPSVAKFEKILHGIPDEKMDLLYLGSDIVHSHFDIKAREKIRNKYSITNEDLVIITTGKFSPEKKTERLIEAVKRINNPKLRLMVVGTADPKRMNQLKEYTKGDSRILVIGWVPGDKLFEYFSAADIGIWPACQTASFQEAIGCSLPIIIKHYYGTEYLTQYQNGFQLYSDSIEEIIEKIEFFIAYPNILKEMRIRAEKLAKEVLSYEIIAKKSLQPYYEKR